MRYVVINYGAIRKEVRIISGRVARGLLEIIIPPPKRMKPKWCMCMRCGMWHPLEP